MKIIFWSCVSVCQSVCSQRVPMWPLPWSHWSVTGGVGSLWTYSNLFLWWDPGGMHKGGRGVCIRGSGSAYRGVGNAGGTHPTGMLPCYVTWSHLVEFPLLHFFYFWCYTCLTSACLYSPAGRPRRRAYPSPERCAVRYSWTSSRTRPLPSRRRFYKESREV